MKSSLSQQITSKGTNFSIYSPQIYNSLQQGQSLVYSADKPKNKQNVSINILDSPDAPINSSSNLITSTTLSNSANFNSNQKNNSQNNMSSSKTSAFASQQSNSNISSSTNNISLKSQQPQLNFSKEMNLLLHKKMVIQQHRRAESTKLAQQTQLQNSISTNPSSQKQSENQIFFSKVDNSITFNNQSNTNQTINTSRSGEGSTPILTASVPSNIQLIQSIDLNPQRDTKNNGGRFFLNLANPVQKLKQSQQQILKSNSLLENDPKLSESLQVGKNISTCKSSQNSPNNYQVGDNIVPFSTLLQSQQQHQLSTFSPQKLQRPSKVSICEPTDIFIYDQVKPVNSSFQPISFEQLQNNHLKKIESQKSSINEYKNIINNISNNDQFKQLPISSKYSNNHQEQQLQSPPKVRFVSQLSLSNLTQNQNQEPQALVPPTQEEAKQQFQKILTALQVKDQQTVLSELTSLYSSIFNVKLENENNNMSKQMKKQEQQQQKLRKPEYNQSSNGNDSTSTSSLDEMNVVQNEKIKKMSDEQSTEKINKQQNNTFLEQQVFIVDYVDINKDSLFKLVKEYFQTQTQEPQKYMTLKEQKIKLSELFAIQKWIQDKLLDSIDEEKKARLKTEEQTSIMLLNQEKAIQVMENKWVQQQEQQRSSNNIQSNNIGQQKYKNSPQSRNSVNIIQQ